jgi:beta-propeller repeat-containing protein
LLTKVSIIRDDDPARWRTGLRTYGGVSLGEVWPGIEVGLASRARTVEKVFTIRPGADVSDILLHVEGASSLGVGEDGRLEVATPGGEVTFSAPVAWQVAGDSRDPVAVAYATRGREYGFALGTHDARRTVFIDPLLNSTYQGGSGQDRGYAVAVHPVSGKVYVAGTTQSTDLPGTTGGAQPEHGSDGLNEDVFLARYDSSLTTLEQVTYYGGSSDKGGGGYDDVAGIAFHPVRGEVYIVGTTSSTRLPGRLVLGAQYALRGGFDAYVAWFPEDLTTVLGATYFGGGKSDHGTGIAFNPGKHPSAPDHELHITGRTESSDLPGIVSPWSAQQTHGGGTWDAFVATIRGNLEYYRSSYLGGSADDQGWGVAVHPDESIGIHEVYVTGETRSTDFPGVTGGAQEELKGGADVFVTRLNPILEMSQSTYVGGSEDEDGRAIAIFGGLGGVYVTGTTRSRDLAGRKAGHQTKHGGDSRDAFVTLLSSTLADGGILDSTYLGGEGNEEGHGIAISPTNGNVYVVGNTTSTGFPGTGGAAQLSNAGDQDAFVARFGLTLGVLQQATYLGGNSRDTGYSVAVSATGHTYVTGLTWSNDFPTVTNPVQPNHAGGVQDAYVAHLDASLAGGGKTRRFELVKGTVRLKSSGWKLELKKVYLDAGERGYAGTGSDITVNIDGVEYFPPADRIVKVGSSKITIKDATRGHKLTIKTSTWKTYLKLKSVPEGDMNPADGLTVRMTLQGSQGDLTANLLPGSSKKLAPVVGTMVDP